MYDFLDTSTPNSGLGTPLRSGGEIINANFRKLHMWMEGRANIATSNIPTLAVGGPRYLLATEFVTGQPMPLAVYERTSTPPSDVTNPAWIQSSDLQWWKLSPVSGDLFVEQFGGKADYVTTLVGTTDNYGPITKAIAFISRSWSAVANHSYCIRFGYGDYWVSQMIDLHTTSHLKGSTNPGGLSPWGTYLYFPNTVTCILVSQNNTVGEAGVGTNTGQGNASTIEGISFQHRYETGSFGPLASFDPNSPGTGHGIHARTYCTIKDCGFTAIAGHAIYIHGGSGFGGAREGQANEFKIHNVEVHSCGGDGLRISDQDANAASIIGFSTRTCGGSGIHSENAFVNTFTGIHLAGYGNWVVRYGGKLYQLIGGIGHPTINGATVTPGTNNLIWYDMGTDTIPGSPHVVDYSPSLDFSLYRLPIWDGGGGNVYTGVYVETSVAICHVSGASMLVGGTNSATSYSHRLLTDGTGAFVSKGGFAQHQELSPGQTGYSKFGATPYVKLGGENLTYGMGTNGGPGILSWAFPEAAAPGGSEAWELSYFLNRITMHSAYGDAFYLGTAWGTDTFGRTNPDYNRGRMIIPDPIVVDPNSLEGRRIGYRVDPPNSGDASTGGEHARGDFYFTTIPGSYGALGWSVTATGVPGTFATVPLLGLTSVEPFYNGHMVFENTSNTQFKLKYKGTDGTTRSATITLS